MESILITGASGFIGSFIVEEALKRKFGVWAGIRSSSSREYLRNRKIHILELDFAHPNELRAQLSGHKGTYNKFDYIIHCAGVTKCTDKREFDRVNYLQTKYFVDTLRELNMIPKQFIYISTLSVFGPVQEKTYRGRFAPAQHRLRIEQTQSRALFTKYSWIPLCYLSSHGSIWPT